MKFRSALLLILLSFLLAACDFSLAEDITPPPGYRSPTPQPTLGSLYPAQPPSPARGMTIYSLKCEPCHGEAGLGNGPFSQQMPVAVPAIGLREISSQSSPSDWYTVISQGSIERGMPPFSSLTEQERWDVLSYVYELSATDDERAQGAVLYAQKCATCHGSDGRGDGAQAASLASSPTNLRDPRSMAGFSGTDLYQAIASGVSPDMAGFGSQLSAGDIWALVAYLRTFIFDLTTPAPPVPASSPTLTEPASTAAASTPVSTDSGTPGNAATAVTPLPASTSTVQAGSIDGSVAISSGSLLPSGLSVTLHGYDVDPVGGTKTEAVTQSMPLPADGTFLFADIPVPSGRIFYAEVEFEGVPFQSDTVTAAKDSTRLDLNPITLYEVSQDMTAVQVDQLHIILDFSTPGSMQVLELYVLSVSGSRAVYIPSDGTSIPFIKLPEGASGVSYQQASGSAPIIGAGNGFALLPLPSGQNYDLLAVYSLPYTGKLSVSLPFVLAADAVSLFSPEGVKVQGDQLTAGTPQTIQGATYAVYTVQALSANASLELNITGSPAAASTSGGGLQTGIGLTIGLGALGLVLVGIGIYFFMRDRLKGKSAPGPGVSVHGSDALGQDVDGITDAILLLDDQYKAGEISNPTYAKRRSELKERLRSALEADDSK